MGWLQYFIFLFHAGIKELILLVFSQHACSAQLAAAQVNWLKERQELQTAMDAERAEWQLRISSTEATSAICQQDTDAATVLHDQQSANAHTEHIGVLTAEVCACNCGCDQDCVVSSSGTAGFLVFTPLWHFSSVVGTSACARRTGAVLCQHSRRLCSTRAAA
jgi:hypothetical protein